MTDKSATPATLWDRYLRLSAGPKTVLRLKSLVFLPTSKADFLKCLGGTGLRAPNGKPWNYQTANDALNELARHKLLAPEWTCPTALLHPLTIDAMDSDQGPVMAAAVLRTVCQPQYRGYGAPSFDRDTLQRWMRLSVYTDDGESFVRACSLNDKNFLPPHATALLALSFSAIPLDPDWLASRRSIIQSALFEAKLLGFFATGAAPPDLAQLAARYRAFPPEKAFATVRPMLMQFDLLQGNLAGIRSGLTLLDGPDDHRRSAFEGALAFIEGRTDAALDHYRTALKQYRKLVGKRKVFLDPVHGVFFMMAQLQANDAKLHTEIQAGLDIALADTDSTAFAAIQGLLWLAQGQEGKVRVLLAHLRSAKTADPFFRACVALLAHAADPIGTSEKDLGSVFGRVREHLPLVARIYAEILVDVAAVSAPYEDYLRQTGEGFGVEFTKLIQQRQPWERALQSLDTFLGGGVAAKGPPKPKRLAWFIDPDNRNVEVAEQSIKGKTGWTDGRPVALKRLHDRDPRLDYLTDQDRLALRSLRREIAGYYGEESFGFDTDRTILALIGHPVLFDARHRLRPLELVRYPVELVVTERRGGYHVTLSHTAPEATLFLEAETPTRYRVVEFPATLLPLQDILGKSGLDVPKDGRDQLVSLVQRDNPALPIRAEIAEVAQAALAGDATPVVQFMPFQEGLKLTLLVRPFGADGPAFVAGLGARSVLATRDGKAIRANRDLAREVALRGDLVTACPTLRDRAGAEAHELIVEDLEGSLELLLEVQAYAGPVLVEWPEGRQLRVSTVSAQKMKLRVAKDRDWFSVDGTIALDEEQVVEMRFLLDRLDRSRGRFVALEDGRFVALTRQLQAQLQRFASVSEPHKAGRRVHALGASALIDMLDEGGEVKADAAWKRHVSRIRSAEGWTPKLPATLQAELRDYQVEGFVWLSRLARWGAGACLADDMGLGKTLQAIAVLLDRAEEGPSLVVAPTSVCPNWVAEIARFAPTLSVHRLYAVADRAAIVAGLGPRDILVCSYGLLHQSAELLCHKHWQVAVLDEAQAIKNAETKRAQASLSLQADFRLALTGTPVENYLDELWSLFNFVNPGLLGSREGFQKRFAGPIERDGDANARQALRALVRPFLLRRTKSAVLSELPSRTEQTIQIEMTEGERAFYEALRQRALASIAGLDTVKGRRKIHILAEITKLRRACCNPALIDAAAGVPSGKLDALLELVDELIRNRHRALVFSQFVGHLSLVREALDARQISYEYLDGSTPSAERERRVAAFQSGKADLFLISLRAGGTGLNLTAADYVIHLDPWWNPAVEDQASDRAHRIGQERPVTIYRLIMQDSIEEQILRLHRDKRNLASELLEGGETAARLSEDELLDLIRA